MPFTHRLRAAVVCGALATLAPLFATGAASADTAVTAPAGTTATVRTTTVAPDTPAKAAAEYCRPVVKGYGLVVGGVTKGVVTYQACAAFHRKWTVQDTDGDGLQFFLQVHAVNGNTVPYPALKTAAEHEETPYDTYYPIKEYRLCNGKNIARPICSDRWFPDDAGYVFTP